MIGAVQAVVRRTARVVAAGAVLAAQSAAEEPAGERPRYRIPKIAAPISVDAHLDEPAWQTALVFELPYETRPGENVAPPVRTECRLMYSASHLYYGCHAFDPQPQQIRARFTDRDIASFTDDAIGLAIDPFNSQNRSFVLDVNPLGVQNDRLYTEASGRSDRSWDAIWDSAGRITDDGFVVEVAIPFSSLRFPRTAGEQVWGFNFRRYHPRDVTRRIALVPQDRNDRCRVCQMPELVGFDGVDPGRNLEVTPTLVGIQTASRSDAGTPLERDDPDFEPGLTVRWGLTPNVALGAALNPDFSQVEADVAQLDINQEFALFFPERRPFFLEGADYFSTPLFIVNTRSVADPSWGLKVTGKEGRHAVGAFVARDDQTNVLLPGPEGSSLTTIDGESTASVLRYRTDVGQASTVGVLLTDRSAGRYSNTVGGVDARFRFDAANTLQVQALGSQTSYGDAVASADSELEDYALAVAYTHDRRNWGFSANYNELAPDFRADLGFIPRVDVRGLGTTLTRRFFGDADRWFTSIQLGGGLARQETQSGALLSESRFVFASYAGPGQTNVALNINEIDRVFLGQSFDQQRSVQVSAFMQPSSTLGWGLTVQRSDAIDIVDVRPGKRWFLRPSVSWTPGKHVRAELFHTFQKLDIDAGELFEAEVSELRIVYQWSVRSFVRLILQSTDIVRDPALHSSAVAPRARDLFGQALFSYKLNPQTALFVGYTGDYVDVLGQGLTETANTLFLKLGYAWQP